MCGAVRDKKVVLGNGHLAVNGCIVAQHAHRASGGRGKVVEQKQTAEQINGVVRHIPAEKGAENKVHRQQQEQGR